MLAVFPPDDTTSGSSLFFVNPSNGVLSTVGIFERDGVDGKSYYDIDVLATDGGTPARSVNRFIRVTLLDVNDNAPEFRKSHYTLKMYDLVSPGTRLKLFTATDADLTYTLSYGIEYDSSDGWFRFSSTTPSLMEVNKKFHKKNGVSIINLKIIVVDGGSPELTGTSSVRVNIIRKMHRVVCP